MLVETMYIYIRFCIIYAHFCYSAEVQFRKSQKHTAPPDHTRGFPLAKFIKSKVGEPRLQILCVVIFCYGANIRKLQAAPKLTSFSFHLQICLLSTAAVRHETLLNCSQVITSCLWPTYLVSNWPFLQHRCFGCFQ